MKYQWKGKQYRFIDLPQKHTLDEYEEAAAAVGRILHCSDIVSLYQTGTVGAPGLSDLDFIFVTRDKPNGARIRTKWDAVRKRFPYFIIHDPYVVQQSLVPHLNRSLPLFIFEKLFGQDLAFAKLTPQLARILLANELAISSLTPYMNAVVGPSEPFALRRKHGPVTIRTRNLLCRLHSIKYVDLLYRTAVKKSFPGLKEFHKNIASLRSSWFTLGDEKYGQLLELNDAYIDLILRLIEDFSSFLSQDVTVSGIDHTTWYLFPRITHFSRTWKRTEAFEKMVDHYKKTGVFVSYLPLVLAAQLMLHPRAQEYFSRIGSVKHPQKKSVQDIFKSGTQISTFMQQHNIPAALVNRMDSVSWKSTYLRPFAKWFVRMRNRGVFPL